VPVGTGVRNKDRRVRFRTSCGCTLPRRTSLYSHTG
jgi:hypothetical protein